MKNSEILIAAREWVRSGKRDYICHAITRESYPLMEGKRHYLLFWVSELLAGHGTYEGWLANQHPKIFKKMSAEDLRQGRLQWIDWMIQYWKEQGQ